MKIDHDELSECITSDLRAVCDLEEKLPRMQWLQVLMTFLRLSLPMWLLAQMRITELLHSWLLNAVDRHEKIPTTEQISQTIANRK